MLIDDLKEKLASAEPDIKTILSYWTNAQFEVRFNELAAITNQENFWQHEQRDTLLKEFHNIKDLFERYNTIISSYKESQELIELFQEDEVQLAGVRDDIHRIGRDIAKFKLELLLNQKED